MRLTPVSSRLALRVLTSVPLAAPDVRRSGEEVVIALGDVSAEAVSLPPLEPPVEALRFERGAGGLSLHVRGRSRGALRDGARGRAPDRVVRRGARRGLRVKSARELYGQLFPVPLGDGPVRPDGGTEDDSGAGRRTAGGWAAWAASPA